MDIKQLFDDDRAVSPVIGVILMVAITVILAAVIGTFVLGLGDQVQSTTPQASFGFETVDDKKHVEITHESGDSIAKSDLTVSATAAIAGAGGNSQAWTDAAVGSSDDKVSAGDSANVTADGTDWAGETIRVVYENPDSDSSSTLGKFEVPSN